MTTSLATINSINLTQLSMDGPSVNWLLFDLLEKQHEEQELPKLLNIGSCNLHVIQGAFKSGFQSVEWNIGKLMKASYNLFHDLPARRAGYVTFIVRTSQVVFAQKGYVQFGKTFKSLKVLWNWL